MSDRVYMTPSPLVFNQHAYLNVLLLNARSVRGEKTVLISEHIMHFKADIVLLTETWLKDGDEPVMNELTPPGFDSKFLHRAIKKGGGLGIIFNSKLTFKSSERKTFIEFECLEVISTKPHIIFVLIYRPPKSNSS